jgi:hypothetical protein
MKREAQWETGNIEQATDEFVHNLIPATKQIPISDRQISLDPQKKNQNKTNPFKQGGEPTLQTGDDQPGLGFGFNDQGGYLPVMASRLYRLKVALWDSSLTVPGMKDPSEGWGAPYMGAGEAIRKEENVRPNWAPMTDKDKSYKLKHRVDTNEDQIEEILDLTREVSDGEKI